MYMKHINNRIILNHDVNVIEYFRAYILHANKFAIDVSIIFLTTIL